MNNSIRKIDKNLYGAFIFKYCVCEGTYRECYLALLHYKIKYYY